MILSCFTTDIAPAAEALAQFAPYTTARRFVGDHELRFAFTAESFLPGFHGTLAGSDGHGTKLDTATALLAELGTNAEGVIHVAVLAPPHKADRLCLPDLGANPHAASA